MDQLLTDSSLTTVGIALAVIVALVVVVKKIISVAIKLSLVAVLAVGGVGGAGATNNALACTLHLPLLCSTQTAPAAQPTGPTPNGIPR